MRASCRTVAPDAALTCFAVVFDWYLDGVVVELERSFSVAASPRRSNLQIEIALAGLASKVVLGAIATAGWPQISDHFIGYPATGTLEIVSTDRHETAKALQRVVRNMKPSFYLDLCGLDCRQLTLKISKIVLRVYSQFRGNFDKLIGV